MKIYVKDILVGALIFAITTSIFRSLALGVSYFELVSRPGEILLIISSSLFFATVLSYRKYRKQ